MTNTVQLLAEKYRALASWMEFHDVLPWHVGINWSRDGLIVHLREQSFSRIFAKREVEMIIDDQGTTWTVESEQILFTCFVPSYGTENLNQIFEQPQAQKTA